MTVLRWLLAAFMIMAPMRADAILLAGGPGPFNGPGSPGFLSTCSATFAITNKLLQSNTFGTSPWTATGTGVAAPTLTAGQSDPDGGSNATKVDTPAVSGSNGSYLSQALSSDSQWPYMNDIYVRGAVGGEKFAITANSNGSDFTGTYVTLTTSWQRVSLQFVDRAANQFIEIGPDLRDSGQSSSSAQTFYIYHGQSIEGTGAYLEWTYIATTTAAVTQNQTANCPALVAFRDFAPLTYYVSNPIIPQNTQTYNAGGTSGPYTYSWGTYGSSGLWAFYNCTVAGGNRDNWPGHCLTTSSTGNPLAWTDYSAGNPLISASSGQWDDNYLLHSAILPGCSLGTRCIALSARAASQANSSFNVGLWYNNDSLSVAPTGTWTQYASNPLPLNTVPGVPGPGLPTFAVCGSTQYMYVVRNGNASIDIAFYTSDISDGVTWKFGGIAIPTPISGVDWTHGSDAFNIMIDPGAFKNSHGFIEMAYTYGATPPSQTIGYAVSSDCKTFYKYQTAAIITNSSLAYPGTFFIGDVIFEEDGTKFRALWNYDDGINQSAGVISDMADH